MNVHKHIPRQASALCMLSKHPGVSYRFFPSTGAVSSEEKIGVSVLST